MRGIVLGLALAIPVPAAVGSENPVVLKPVVVLKTAELRVGDLVALRGGRLPSRIAAMVVMRLPRNGATLELPAARAAALVRRRVPALRPVPTPGAVVRITVPAAPPEAEKAGACFAAAGGIAAGTALSAGDVTAVSCRNAPAAALRYGAGGLAIAEVAVPAGGYLGRLAALPERAIGKGTSLVLRSTSGPVTIERPVVAMQPARSGGKLFVRDANGTVFPAPLALSGGQAQ